MLFPSVCLSQPFTRHANRIAAALLALIIASAATAPGAQTRPLNDTGQLQCYDATSTAVAVNQANCGDGAANPRQGPLYGRDAAAAAGTLTKAGAGAAGFDYTKIANNGSALPASAVLGSGATDWACTKDNVTGLVWEIRTSAAGLRNRTFSYRWYSTDSASNGGDVGAVGTASNCGSTLATCDTQSYVNAVNAATLCGASDWRLPSQKELLSIVHSGVPSPSIDSAYFPDTTPGLGYWTTSTGAAVPSYAWVVYFSDGKSQPVTKSSSVAVRLVRGGV